MPPNSHHFFRRAWVPMSMTRCGVLMPMEGREFWKSCLILNSFQFSVSVSWEVVIVGISFLFSSPWWRWFSFFKVYVLRILCWVLWFIFRSMYVAFIALSVHWWKRCCSAKVSTWVISRKIHGPHRELADLKRDWGRERIRNRYASYITLDSSVPSCPLWIYRMHRGASSVWRGRGICRCTLMKILDLCFDHW